MSADWQNSPPADEYSIEELIISVLAEQFRNDDQATNGMGSFIPVAAFMLARMTHAPDLIWLAGTVGLEPRPKRIPASTLEAPLWKDSIMYIEQYGDAWHYLFSDRWIEKFCVGAAQLDQFGNANNSVIGADYHAPKVRLPGTAGLADLCSLGKKLYYWNLNHSPKSLVEKVDFISGAGYLDGHDTRDKLGLKNGPQLVVTNLAVMDFHKESKRMQLKSVHPGISVDEVQAATGFELLLPQGTVPETARPTEAQLGMIREDIDPDGMRNK
ncbi:MAG: hypothetical protein GKR93_18440 [Gammaproteobacteria bacterium]|nr:hypothetical protein [Gammaproteobacteria bacterium]